MFRNTGPWLRNIVSLIAFMAPAIAGAAGTCYQWRTSTFNNALAWDGTSKAATDRIKDWCNSTSARKDTCSSICTASYIGSTQTCELTVDTYGTVSTFPAYTGIKLKVWLDSIPAGSPSSELVTITMTSRENPEGCSDCPNDGLARILDGATGDAPTSTCSNGCNYYRSGPYINFSAGSSTLNGYIGEFMPNGTACSATANTPETSSTTNDCKATSTDVYCMVKNQNGENCGQVNGEWFCARSTQPGVCTSTQSGGAVCGSNRTDGKTETPPGPDNGTAGTPATPTASVKDDVTGRVTNYYNSTTVNGSTASSSSSSGGSSSSSSGGSSSSSSSGEGTASGGETCEAAPACTGDAIQCALLNQEWRSRCSFSDYTKEELGAPVDGTDGSALTNETQDVSTLFSGITGAGGSCPADIPIDLGDWGTFTLGLEEFCWVFEAIGYAVLISAWLSAAMIVIGHSKGQS